MNPLHTAVSHGIAQGGVQISRRAALASGLALAAAPSQALARSRSVKIERIEIFPLRYPMTGFFKFFTGPHGGAGRAAVIVKVTADDGTFGWGQSVPIAKWSYETLEAATTTLAEYYRPALLGHDPTDIAGAHRKMDSVVAPGFSTGMPITRAGIDIALWDIVGKLADLPLYKLWGRNVAKPLTLSWTVNAVTLDDVDGLIEEGRRRGYQNFNIKVGPDADYDVQLASRVKRLAPNGFLWSDANGGYAPQDALAAAPRLADAQKAGGPTNLYGRGNCLTSGTDRVHQTRDAGRGGDEAGPVRRPDVLQTTNRNRSRRGIGLAWQRADRPGYFPRGHITLVRGV